jgi:hypothetical protein
MSWIHHLNLLLILLLCPGLQGSADYQTNKNYSDVMNVVAELDDVPRLIEFNVLISSFSEGFVVPSDPYICLEGHRTHHIYTIVH